LSAVLSKKKVKSQKTAVPRNEVVYKRLKTYLDEDIEEININPLEYWAERESTMPILSQLAKQYITGSSYIPEDKLYALHTAFTFFDKEDIDLLERYLFLHHLPIQFWKI
jgi:hypothetical protein